MRDARKRETPGKQEEEVENHKNTKNIERVKEGKTPGA